MFETFIVGGTVGLILTLYLFLWNSRYGYIAKILALLTGIAVVIIFIMMEIEFSKKGNNLNQSLLNHPKCEFDKTENRYLIKADFTTKNLDRLMIKPTWTLSVPCEISYADQCKLYQQLIERENLTDSDMRKYFSFLCK